MNKKWLYISVWTSVFFLSALAICYNIHLHTEPIVFGVFGLLSFLIWGAVVLLFDGLCSEDDKKRYFYLKRELSEETRFFQNMTKKEKQEARPVNDLNHVEEKTQKK